MDILLDELAQATDPVILVNETGTVLWKNDALTLLTRCSDHPHAIDLIGAAGWQRISGTNGYGIHQVTFSGDIRQTAIVVELGIGELDDRKLLVHFKSAETREAQIQEREDFLQLVSHDLKNPLGAAFGYADTLLDTPSGEGLSKNQREIVARVRSIVARALDLVRNYQLLATLDNRGVSTVSTHVNLNDIIRDVVDTTWREDFRQPAVSVVLATVPLPVRAEKSHLERVFGNLFTNALKYTPKTGEIRVSAEHLDDGALVRIRNSGNPIRAEDLPRLFTRYTRLDTSRGVAGSGLGLHIVKKIVDGLGGEVRAESDREATEFIVKLPW